MSCQEHVCRRCEHMVFNNMSTGGVCPHCGSTDWISFCDEPAEDYDAYRHGPHPCDIDDDDDWRSNDEDMDDLWDDDEEDVTDIEFELEADDLDEDDEGGQ